MAEVEGVSSKVMNLTKDVFTSPVKTTEPNRDPLIVQSMKIAAGKPAGFSDWQEAATFISGIEDAVAYAAAIGHNLNSLLEG